VHLRWRQAIADGSLLGPTIVTTGISMDGSPPLHSETPRTFDDPAEAARSVTAQKEAGYDAVKVYGQLDPAVYAAIVESARKSGLPVVGHVPYPVGLAAVLEAGQRSIEHLEGYLGALQAADSPVRGVLGKFDMKNMLASFATVDMALAPQLARRTREAGAWNCVTLSLARQFVTADELRALFDEPAMAFVPPLRRLRWRQSGERMPPPILATIKPWFTTQTFALTAALHRAGAKILLGTDAPNPLIVPGVSVHQELANLVQAGLSPFEALATGTAAAAEFLGTTAEGGTIEVGKRADLVLLQGDPLEDIAATTQIAGVGIRGQWLTRGALDRLLEEVVAEQTLSDSALAQAPEWPVDGERLVSRSFQETLGDLTVAVASLAVDAREDGGRLTRGWSRGLTNDSVRTWDVRLESGPGGRLLSARVDGRGGSEGHSTLSFDAMDGQLRVRAVTDDHTTESLEPMPDVILLPYAPLSMDTLWLGVGQADAGSRTLKTLCVNEWWELSGIRLSQGTLEVQGRTDADGAREYDVRVSGCGEGSGSYATDEHGVPLGRVREHSLGKMVAVAQP
jgi:imidazolonepropionase-like amidohydrolase